MNQEKIGKFIAEKRKEKKLTQNELAIKLGVSDRTVGNWECGRNMPDLSLFKPLCEILDISINDLLSGEEIDESKQDKYEENIMNTIDYSSKKLYKFSLILSLVVIIFGLFIAISAIMIFPSDSSWSSIYSTFGIVIFVFGISILLKQIKLLKRLIILGFIFICSMALLFLTDYINVINNDVAPRFRITTTYVGDVIYYDTPFYDAYRCYHNNKNEYWVIKKNSKPSIQELLYFCK